MKIFLSHDQFCFSGKVEELPLFFAEIEAYIAKGLTVKEFLRHNLH